MKTTPTRPRDTCHAAAVTAVALLAALLASRTAHAGEKSPYMQKGKQQSLTINANVDKATIMADGLFVGHAGAAFDTTPGTHALIVAAPGHVPRLIRIQLSSQSRSYQVNLVPVPAGIGDIEIDYAQARALAVKQPVTALKGLCASYNQSGAALSRELMLPCARSTLFDDFAYFGRSWLSADVKAGDAARQSLVSNLGNAATEGYYWQAEELYAAAPNDAQAATLLAYSAALRQDCSRVLEISLEHGSYAPPAAAKGRKGAAPAPVVAPGLLFVRGLCFEMAGLPDKAARLYLHLASAMPPPVDLLYHLARVQAPIAPDSAVKTLRVCTKAHPGAYPCYEAAAQVLAAGGKKPAAEALMRVYHQRTKTALAKVFAGGSLNAAAVRAAVAERPFSFELKAAEALLARVAGKTAMPSTEQALISDPAIVRQLLPQLEESTAPARLLPIYALLARRFPGDASSWIRLAAGYRSEDRCTESVKAANRALTLINDDQRRAALLVSTTECLVRMDKLTEAETILQQVIESGAAGWKAYYNLGVVQERLGKPETARQSYELALAGDVPATIRTRVEAKLASLKPAPAAKDTALPVTNPTIND